LTPGLGQIRLVTAHFQALAFRLAFLLLTCCSLSAQTLVEPPFGLRWGDSPEKLIAWAGRHTLDVTITLPGDQPGLRIIRIAPRKGPLPETQAGAVEGRFLAGKLFELTVHYTDPDASADLMKARFDELRRQLTKVHGPFLANRQQRSVEDQFATRTESFHREPVRGLFMLLAFTELEDLIRQSKEARFAMIYRNDNLKTELQKELAQIKQSP
jgi:hypothetical protein